MLSATCILKGENIMTEKTKKRSKSKKGYGLKSISARLLIILVPIVAVFIVGLTLFVALQARTVIISRAKSELHQESRANANEISGRMASLREYYTAVGQTLESIPFKDNNEIFECFQYTVNNFPEAPTGLYLGLENKEYIDCSGWVPDEGYDPTTRPWYTGGLGKSTLFLSIPRLDMSTGGACVSMSKEITLKDSRRGVMSVDIFLADIAKEVAVYTPGGTGQAMLFDGSMIIAAPQDGYNATDVSEHPDDTFLGKINSVVTGGGSNDIKEIEGKYVSFDPVEGTSWTMVSFVDKKDVLAEINTFIVISIIIMIIALAIIITVMLIVISRVITKPTAVLTESIAHIANGEFIDIDISKAGEDEIGDMMRNTHSLTETLREVVSDVKKASSNLGESSEELAQTSSQISDTTDGVSEAVQEVAKGATEQADTIQKATENLATLSDAIQNVAGNAEQLAATAAAMNDASQSSAEALRELSSNMGAMGQSMGEITETMKMTNEAVQNVNAKVDGITAIASQTNLLALNASIEAARAGEAGKGFAVVAEEIGQLATESAQTAEQIRSEMANLLKQSENAINKTDQVSEISTSVNEVLNNTVKQINDLIEEVGTTVDGVNTISALTEECDASKVVIVDAMSSLSAISEENAASTEETSASMEELNATVNVLATSADNLNGIAKQLDSNLEFFKL